MEKFVIQANICYCLWTLSDETIGQYSECPGDEFRENVKSIFVRLSYICSVDASIATDKDYWDRIHTIATPCLGYSDGSSTAQLNPSGARVGSGRLLLVIEFDGSALLVLY